MTDSQFIPYRLQNRALVMVNANSEDAFELTRLVEQRLPDARIEDGL